MSQKLNTAIAVIGIDIGKNSFHLVGLDERGAIVLRQKWSRGQVDAGCQPATVPHRHGGLRRRAYLSRKLTALEHDARLMPAKYVRLIRRGRRTTSATRRRLPRPSSAPP